MQNWQEQFEQAGKATHAYQRDAAECGETGICVFAVDLQKVILLPDLPGNKEAIFLSRLVVFNENSHVSTSIMQRL